MYPFVLCFCGRSLADIYDLFVALRREKYAAAYADIDPYYLPISATVRVDLVDVFEQLNIHMDCCRTRLLTQVEFKNIY